MPKDSMRYYLINDTLNVNLIVLITIKMFIYLQNFEIKKKNVILLLNVSVHHLETI